MACLNTGLVQCGHKCIQMVLAGVASKYMVNVSIVPLFGELM